MTQIIHRRLSYAVNGCVFDVHNALGPGLREECYQEVLEVSLAGAGLPFLGKPRTRRELIYLGETAAIFEPDLLVDDRLLVELKALREGLASAHFRQTFSYLKFWRISLGLLVNFAGAQAEIARIVFEDRIAKPEEDYDFVRELISSEVRPILVEVREVVQDVHRQFGLGYCDTTYQRLIAIGLAKRGLPCATETAVTPEFRGRKLPSSRISPLIVGDRVLVEVEAVKDEITARAIRTMQTHLKLTGAALGLVVNFGKHRFQIRGVRPLREPHE